MATRTELLEKAKAAKAAKAAGTVGAFVADSKQKRATIITSKAASPPPATISATTPATASSASKAVPFGGLSSLRRSSSMDEEVSDPNDHVDENPEAEDRMGRAEVRDFIEAEVAPGVNASLEMPPTDHVLAATIPGPEVHRAPAPPARVGATGPDKDHTAFAGPVAGAKPKTRPSSDGGYGSHAAAKLPEIKASTDADPAWEERSIPAGSQFTLDEWNAARSLGNFVVFEMRSGSQGALVQVPRAPMLSQSLQKVVVNGKVGTGADVEASIDPHSTEYMSPLTAILIEGCMLLGPKAPTTHPAAATSLYTVRMPDGKDWLYRVVRPSAHRDDPQTAWLFTARGRLPFIAEVPENSQDRTTRADDEMLSLHQTVVANDTPIAGMEYPLQPDAEVTRERMTG